MDTVRYKLLNYLGFILLLFLNILIKTIFQIVFTLEEENLFYLYKCILNPQSNRYQFKKKVTFKKSKLINKKYRLQNSVLTLRLICTIQGVSWYGIIST